MLSLEAGLVKATCGAKALLEAMRAEKKTSLFMMFCLSMECQQLQQFGMWLAIWIGGRRVVVSPHHSPHHHHTLSSLVPVRFFADGGFVVILVLLLYVRGTVKWTDVRLSKFLNSISASTIVSSKVTAYL
jgi:hypothetical protein